MGLCNMYVVCMMRTTEHAFIQIDIQYIEFGTHASGQHIKANLENVIESILAQIIEPTVFVERIILII